MHKLKSLSLVLSCLLLVACSSSNKEFIVTQIKPFLPPITPLSVKGLNGYIVKDANNKPQYLVVLYATVKKAKWKQDQITMQGVDALNYDKVNQISQSNPEYLYLKQQIELHFLVKKLNQDSNNKIQPLKLPYFVILNVDNSMVKDDSSQNNLSQDQSMPVTPSFPKFKTIGSVNKNGFGGEVNSGNIQPQPSVNINNNAITVNTPNQPNSQLYLITQGDVTIEFINNTTSEQSISLPVNLQFKPSIINNLQLLVGFKLNNDQYQAIQQYLLILKQEADNNLKNIINK